MTVNSTTLNYKNTEFSLEQQFQAGDKLVWRRDNHDWQERVRGEEGVKDFHSFTESVSRYFKDALGVLRFGQLTERGANVAIKMGASSPALEHVVTSYGNAWKTIFTVPYTVSITRETVDAGKDGFYACFDRAHSPTERRRTITTGVNKVAEGVSMYALVIANTAVLFSNTKQLMSKCFAVCDVSGLCRDVTSLAIDVEKYSIINNLETVDELDETVQQTKTCLRLALIKDIVSIASGILAVGMLVMGAPLLPAVCLAVISLSAAILSTSKELYEETMIYKPIHAFKDISVVQ